jgi:hypothetical protein
MKRIENTNIWTDGVVKYSRNDQGEMLIYEEPADIHIVELDEPVVLKPVAPKED